MKQKTIIVSHLKKYYGQKVVTDDISVTFNSGQIVAIVGHNGAGKSTFLNQINGKRDNDEQSNPIGILKSVSCPQPDKLLSENNKTGRHQCQ